MIHSEGILPLYLQVAELFVRDIAAGRLIDGERLAPEREMAAKMGVAVGTLRKALAELQSRGLLERVQGSGNYVRMQSDRESIYSLFRLERLEGGGRPTAEVLSVLRLRKPADLPIFGVSPEAHRIRRLRRLDGEAAAVEEIWLDASYTERIEIADLSDSLYLHYRTRLGLWIVRAEDRIGLGAVPGWAPPTFGPAPGAAAPLVLRLGQSREGDTAEVSRTWIDTAVASYVVRLK